MAYQALVAKLVNVRPHSNADRLQLATVSGYQVVVGLDAQEDDVCVIFPPDGQLSEEYAQANDLVGYTDEITGEKKGGYFAKNRRVRSQRLRGEKSECYVATFDSFEYTGYDLSKLKVGDAFDSLDKHEICNKYYTPATLRAMNQVVKKRQNAAFAEHVDTKQFRYEVDSIKPGSLITITEKVHGTSGRLGHLLDDTEVKAPWYKRVFGTKTVANSEYKYLLGTRRTIKADHNQPGFYASEEFRWDSVERLQNNLHKGEILYYEIVGYTGTGQLIMGAQDTSELKDIKKQYGKEMVFKYGQPEGTCKIYVYRIVRTNEDGNLVDLSWVQTKARCHELGVDHVPEMLPQFLVDEFLTPEGFKANIDTLLEGPSTLDPSHIREGVVVRVDAPTGETQFLKAKSFTFGVLEGYLKNTDDYVDTEEIS